MKQSSFADSILIAAVTKIGNMDAVGNQPTGPTDSHILSQVEQDEKGLSQKPHVGPIDNTSDIGWGASPHEFEKRIVSGLSNEDLWMLIRRFNKVCLHIDTRSRAGILT